MVGTELYIIGRGKYHDTKRDSCKKSENQEEPEDSREKNKKYDQPTALSPLSRVFLQPKAYYYSK